MNVCVHMCSCEHVFVYVFEQKYVHMCVHSYSAITEYRGGC